MTRLRKLVIECKVRKEKKIAVMRTGRIFSDVSDLEGIVGVHCVCHRFALVVSDAIKHEFIPPVCSDLLTELYAYFSKSGMRKKSIRLCR